MLTAIPSGAATSVRTLVVSWKLAADRKESDRSAAFVMTLYLILRGD
jgi:hypothetical protein